MKLIMNDRRLPNTTQRRQAFSAQETADPSTPTPTPTPTPPSQSSSSLSLSSSSSRPLPPWPVSPASYSSPETTSKQQSNSSNIASTSTSTSVCPGAPTKNRYPASRRRFYRDDDDEDNDDDNDEDNDNDNNNDAATMFRRGIRPRRLAFHDDAIADYCDSEVEHEGTGEGTDEGTGARRNNTNDSYPIWNMGISSSPRSSPLRHDHHLVLGLPPRKQRETTPVSMGVVPTHTHSSSSSSSSSLSTREIGKEAVP